MSDDLKLLRDLEAKAEAAYDAMYETHSPGDASACYRDAKDYFREAIALAHRMGDNAEADRLLARLVHVKAVFRSQFT